MILKTAINYDNKASKKETPNSIFYFINKERLNTFLTLFFMSSASIMMTLFLISISNFVDKLLTLQSEAITSAILLLSISGMTMQFAHYFANIYKAKTIQKINTSMRESIYDYIGSLSYQSIYQDSPERLIAWYTTDIQRIENTGVGAFFNMYKGLFSMLVNSIATFYISKQLLLVAIVLLIPNVIFPFVVKNKQKKESLRNSKQQEQFMQKISSIINGLDIVFSNDVLQEFKNRVTMYSRKLEHSNYSYTIFGETLSVISSCIFRISNLLTYVFLGYLFIRHSISIGLVTTGGNIAGQVYDAANISIFQGGMSIVESNTVIRKIFSEHNVKTDKAIGTETENCRIDTVELKNISYNYGEKLVFSHINLKIEQGKKYLIHGQSGTGKTTLLKILLGLIQDYEGVLEFNGTNVHELPFQNFRKNIAYIPQAPYLFDETLEFNLTLGKHISQDDIMFYLKYVGMDQWYQTLSNGLQTIIKDNLSGGQRQRLTIVRALLQQKSVLIIDEGTSSLDSESKGIVEGNLFADDLTIIMVSHHIDSARMEKFDEILKL